MASAAPADKGAPPAAPQEAQPTTAPILEEFSPFPDDTGDDSITDLIFGTFGSDGEPEDKSASPTGGTGGGSTATPSGADAAAQGAGGVQPSAPASAQPSQPATGAPSQPQVSGGGQQPPVSTPAPAAVAPDETALRLQHLEATIQSQAALIEQLRKPQGGQAGQPAANTDQPAPQQLQPIGIPQEILNGIYADDDQTRSSALTTLVNGIDAVVRRRVMQEVDRLVTNRIAAIPTPEPQNNAAAQQQEYFAEFPHHNKPAIRAIIEQQASGLWTEMPNLPWTKESRAALAARVDRSLTELGVQAPALNQPTPASPQEQPPVARRPASMSGQGTRPAPAADSAGSFIKDTFA